MTISFQLRIISVFCFALTLPGISGGGDEPVATREFEIKGDRAYLGGEPVELWGLRCGNALHSEAITERHIRNWTTWWRTGST
jgi:hypothetical protein